MIFSYSNIFEYNERFEVFNFEYQSRVNYNSIFDYQKYNKKILYYNFSFDYSEEI